jgi:hypothetical protein
MFTKHGHNDQIFSRSLGGFTRTPIVEHQVQTLKQITHASLEAESCSLNMNTVTRSLLGHWGGSQRTSSASFAPVQRLQQLDS